MTQSNGKFLVLLGLLFVAGCSEAAPELQSVEGASAPTSASTHTGFSVELSDLGVDLGPPEAVKPGLLDVQIGTRAAFSVNRRNGAKFLVPSSAGEAEANERPFIGSGEEHNQVARDFFLAHGLPSEQIGTVTALASGTYVASEDNPRGTLVRTAYCSAVLRVIDGVEIGDSLAVVRFDGDRNLVSLTVHWPELPKATIEEAKAFEMPAPLPGAGRVIVHHTRAEEDEPLRTWVSYDVAQGNNLRSYDRNGIEIGGTTTRTPARRVRAGADPERPVPALGE